MLRNKRITTATSEQDIVIRNLYDDGWSISEISDRYKISEEVVRDSLKWTYGIVSYNMKGERR